MVSVLPIYFVAQLINFRFNVTIDATHPTSCGECPASLSEPKIIVKQIDGKDVLFEEISEWYQESVVVTDYIEDEEQFPDELSVGDQLNLDDLLNVYDDEHEECYDEIVSVYEYELLEDQPHVVVNPIQPDQDIIPYIDDEFEVQSISAGEEELVVVVDDQIKQKVIKKSKKTKKTKKRKPKVHPTGETDKPTVKPNVEKEAQKTKKNVKQPTSKPNQPKQTVVESLISNRYRYRQK